MAATALNCNTMLRIMYIMLNHVSGVDCGSPCLLPQYPEVLIENCRASNQKELPTSCQ